MTRKHFIEFARRIKLVVEHANTLQEGSNVVMEQAVSQYTLICDVACMFNARFNADKFRKACGL